MLPTPTPIQDPHAFALAVIRARDDWRRTLEGDYQATSRRLQDAYGRVTPVLQARLDALTAVLRERGETSVGELRGLRGYQDLLERIDAEMDGFARIVDQENRLLADRAIGHGGRAAFDLAAAQDARIAAAWIRPDPAALARLVDYVDGEAMRARVAAFGANAARHFGDTMLALVAQGKNPVEIARRLRQWFGFPYSWAENQARTAQIWSYRAATHASYRANADVLDGWVWSATLDSRTCMSCISQHGTKHRLDETLNDHHRGRCAALPLVKGATWHESMETGIAWFERQPPQAQREMLGRRRFEAYRRGRLDLRAMSRPYVDGVYGTMLREATLRELGIA